MTTALLTFVASGDDKRDFGAPPEPGGVHPDIEEHIDMTQGKRSKDHLIISRHDKDRLIRLLGSIEPTSEVREELEDLTRELMRGDEVGTDQVPPDVVTMNSTVRVTDVESGSTHVYTIVFPADADYEKGKISILAPLGTALLGYRVGDVVDWHMPRGIRRLRIDEIIYQPEAAGDSHL
jgi:regulator of nucleoside diphosphate kinase